MQSDGSSPAKINTNYCLTLDCGPLVLISSIFQIDTDWPILTIFFKEIHIYIDFNLLLITHRNCRVLY